MTARPAHLIDADEDVESLVGRVEATLGRRKRHRIVRRRALAIGTVALAAVAVVGLYDVFNKPARLQPLAHASGKSLSAGDVLEVGVASLSDGSELALGPGAELRVAENEPHQFATSLMRGEVTFNVEPSRNRQRVWRVRVEAVTVTVTGTRFTVGRNGELMRVTVTHGEVVVEGAPVPADAKKLRPGDSIEVPLTPARQAPEDTGPPEAHETADSAGSADPGPNVTQTSHTTILHQTDKLRREGKHRAAARLLERALVTTPRGRESALLAFTLGRIQLENLGQAGAAAQSFSRASRNGLPPALREQAMARTVQAWALAGERQRAISLATRYLQRYPQGPNRNLVLRWLEQPRE